MYNTQPVCKPRLDVAEKARAYDRHTHALKYNKHSPISTQPPLAPSVRIYERSRNEERELIKQKDKINSKIIDEVWKRAHGIPIPNDTSKLSKPQTARTRAVKKPWSSLLLEKESLFPNKQEQIMNSSRSIHRKQAQFEASASVFSKEPESGMHVRYNKPTRSNMSPLRRSQENSARVPRAHSDDGFKINNNIPEEDQTIEEIEPPPENENENETMDNERPSAIIQGLLQSLDDTSEISQDIVNMDN
ncbi:hypothetical protein TVAGG3_1002280 [Trichomonas vaginalis G3]|uniref:hypothetical protein n=1 Tax=Trichomonas vaginalis (strain ATCC PRA-98 / G3) TaxID=412133 RepID=UPI0021E5A70E|nr:hypothetical protein TVAGG3_1002280 [Trichomonas vaginalis G3]KAI5490877.1 hypothetical protein TVAGG3_1002280 [Trichomonas vaginalis G3]